MIEDSATKIRINKDEKKSGAIDGNKKVDVRNVKYRIRGNRLKVEIPFLGKDNAKAVAIVDLKTSVSKTNIK